MSISTYLKSVKITTKLYLSFGLILVMMMAAAGLSVYGNARLGDIFKQYKDVANQGLITEIMLEHFLEARLAVMKYRNDDKPEH